MAGVWFSREGEVMTLARVYMDRYRRVRSITTQVTSNSILQNTARLKLWEVSATHYPLALAYHHV